MGELLNVCASLTVNHIMQFAPVLLRYKVLGSSINVTAVRKIPNVSILFKMKSYSVNILY